MQQIVECVPNISEGRDEEKIERIIASVSDIDALNTSVHAFSSISANSSNIKKSKPLPLNES